MTKKTLAELKVMFETGKIPDGQDYADFIDATYNAINDALIVQSVNGVAPTNGNVNTDYKIIAPIRADIDWTYYPDGTSEFYVDYDPEEYESYIEENPSFGQLEAGDIAVRTLIIRDRGIIVQQVDNVKNGIFDAAFTRLGNPDGTWGELVKHSSSSTPPKYKLIENVSWKNVAANEQFVDFEVTIIDLDNISIKLLDNGGLLVPEAYTFSHSDGTLTVDLLRPSPYSFSLYLIISEIVPV